MKNLITFILFLTTFLSYSQTKLDSLVFIKVNEYRVSLGLVKVSFDTTIFKYAENQSNYMLTNGVVGHSPSTLNSKKLYSSKLKSGEVCNSVNKSISGYNDLDSLSKDIVNSWIISPEHNKIIKDKSFKFASVSTKCIVSKTGIKNKKNFYVYSTMIFTD